MKYLRTKAYKIFKIIIEWEATIALLKYTASNQYLPLWCRQYAIIALSTLPLAAHTNYLKLRCFFSNRSRSIITLMKMNRVRLKFNINSARVTGVGKASW